MVDSNARFFLITIRQTASYLRKEVGYMVNRQGLITLAISLFWLSACSTGRSTQQPETDAVASIPQCPDLTGKYMIQGEDGQVHISIEQEGCARATIVRQSGYLGTVTSEKHALKLDGTPQEDSPWLGSTD